ncbi:MAG: hypothetical protein WD013_03475 [Gemmatimonadota bacterium]
MFDSLRDAFRQAVENFRNELHRDRIPEAADRLIRAMKQELLDLEAGTRDLEREMEATREESERERASVRTCLRREEMALAIEDEETATVARAFARRHLRRQELLEQKAEVLARQVKLNRSEIDELTARFKETRARRESMSATAGRVSAGNRIREADDLFAELDRMADRIDGFDRRGRAAEDVDEVLRDAGTAEAHDDLEIEDRLEALKRRMDDE